MNAVWTGPASYERARTDVPWDPRYLQLEPPTRVYMLAEFGPDAAGPAALSPMAITTPFRVLSDEGTRILQTICGELEAQATSDVRLPKRLRGGLYRSEFLRGLYSDPTMLGFLRELGQAPVEAHPLSHHALQINYAPDDLAKNVDQWHRDAVSYDYVMMVSDPRPMKGGRFEYFFGSVEEGRDLLLSGQSLPPDRVRSAEFPGAGWAVLQQGYRVLHRAARLEERYPRITMVCSYYTPHPSIADRCARQMDGRLPSSSGAATPPCLARASSSAWRRHRPTSLPHSPTCVRRCARASPMWSRRSRSLIARTRAV